MRYRRRSANLDTREYQMLIQKVAVAALILLLTRPCWAGRPDDYELEVDWLLNSSPFVASVDDDNFTRLNGVRSLLDGCPGAT